MEGSRPGKDGKGNEAHRAAQGTGLPVPEQPQLSSKGARHRETPPGRPPAPQVPRPLFFFF